MDTGYKSIAVASDHTADREDALMSRARNDDAVAAVAGVDDLAVADVQAYMAAVTDKVSRLRVFKASYGSAQAPLGSGGMRQGNAEMAEDGHRKSGTVRSVCQAGTAVYIRPAGELERKLRDALPHGKR